MFGLFVSVGVLCLNVAGLGFVVLLILGCV